MYTVLNFRALVTEDHDDDDDDNNNKNKGNNKNQQKISNSINN